MNSESSKLLSVGDKLWHQFQLVLHCLLLWAIQTETVKGRTGGNASTGKTRHAVLPGGQPSTHAFALLFLLLPNKPGIVVVG
jgi:hypothetical protein